MFITRLFTFVNLLTNLKMKKKLFAAAALLCAAQWANSQVVINEVMTHSDTLEVFGQVCDWIELYNTSPGWVYLKDISISDNPDKPQKWRMNGNYKIEPNGFLTILCNDAASGANTNFKLSAEGETILISDAAGTIIDQVKVPYLMPDQSFGRASDGSDTWAVFKVASPNSQNRTTIARTITPEIDLKGGFYSGAQQVTITCADPNATIYYTLNGSMPTEKSNVYSEPIRVSKTTVIRATAKNPNIKMSDAATNTYFINLRRCDLPVVSLSTDAANFYDDYIGIYVDGKNGIKANCSDGPKNYNQDWERPVHFEYFDHDHKQAVSIDAGVKIFGTCSRFYNAMKSLRIVARKDEYGEKKIEYKFFANKDIDKFKSIVLRDGGNDFQSTMMRDALITQLCSKHMDVDIQELQPAAVFLNGEYLGLHNIREKISDHYIQENYGLEHEIVDLLENKDASIIEGSAKDYKDLIEFVKKYSLSDDKNYEYVKSKIDINNFTDYYIAQLYIDNEDWPNNNIKFWKTNGSNSRWRWILFGAEYSCGVYGGQPNVNSIRRVLVEESTAMGNSAGSARLIKALLQNDSYRDMFLQRFAYHIEQTIAYKNVQTLCDSIKGLMNNEWQYQSQRWYPWLNQQSWSNNVNNLKNWFRNRPSNIMGHLQEVYNLGGTYQLTAKADNNSHILLSGYSTKLDISGTYFKNSSLVLDAEFRAGYGFDHWVVTTKNGDEIVSTENITTYPLVLKTDTDVEVTLVSKQIAQSIPDPRTVSAKGLKINEICTKNGGQVADEYNCYPAWIEIMNPTNTAIDLAGLYIGNGKDYYVVPSDESGSTILSPGAKVLFFADNSAYKGIFHASFELSTSGGSVEIVEKVNDKTERIDQVKYPKLSKNQSYGYQTDCQGDFVTFAVSTPYAANNGKIIEPAPFYVPEKNIATPTDNTVEAVSEVVIYPNPAKEHFTIKGCSDNPQWTIITLNGTSVKNGRGVEADVTDLKSGYYIIRISDNGKTDVIKLLKI